LAYDHIFSCYNATDVHNTSCGNSLFGMPEQIHETHPSTSPEKAGTQARAIDEKQESCISMFFCPG